MKGTYRCWAEIDQSALHHNARIVRERVGSAEIIAVVKANAYGHGLIGVAETLADEAQLFGVANLEEALALRESFSHPIIILGPALPGERSTIAERGFIATISALEEAEDFNRLAHHSPVASANAELEQAEICRFSLRKINLILGSERAIRSKNG